MFNRFLSYLLDISCYFKIGEKPIPVALLRTLLATRTMQSVRCTVFGSVTRSITHYYERKLYSIQYTCTLYITVTVGNGYANLCCSSSKNCAYRDSKSELSF